MKILIRLLLTFFVFVAALSARAEKPVNTTLLGVAIKGYDPVAYFTDGKAVKGDSDYSFEWNGAEWRFASAAHRDLFKANPVKYAPQYGGYCAWAVSRGYTAGIDPEAWKIVNDRLYLNYSMKVQKQWAEDIPGNISKAEENWPKILKN
ncbi:MAG TPA: YHS domain-containing (seleno)protein [Rariglobus sp.]|jgi:YHS domain-containing protein|nr:YHS domain-containing (seleno)protein [Rariglobus sp.]